MYRTYKFRLKPNQQQTQNLNKMLDSIRTIHELYKEYYCNISDMDKLEILGFFIKLKPGLANGDKSAFLLELNELYNSRSLNKEIKNIFQYSTNYFKSADNDVTPIDENFIYLPAVGFIRYYNGEYSKNIRNVYKFTVYKTIDGKFYVDILSSKNQTIKPKRQLDIDSSVGLDYSSSRLYVDNKGNSPEVHHYLKDNIEQLDELKRKLGKYQKDSTRYKNTLKKYVLLHSKIANQRKDWLQKISTSLSNQYDYIFVEHVCLSEIATHRNLGTSTVDNGYRKFVAMIDYKMKERGKKLIEIERYYPTTKKCNYCGHLIDSISLKQRTWQCPNCRMIHNRDINAAINIRNRGIEIVREKAGGQPAC